MKYSEITETIYRLTGVKAKQREIAEILGLRVNAVGLRAARGSEFSAEDMLKIGCYYNIDLFSSLKTAQNIDSSLIEAAQNIQSDENLKTLFKLASSLSPYDRRTIVILAERLSADKTQKG